MISESYRQQQIALHRDPSYGVASLQYSGLVAAVAVKYGVREMLDYGAGKCRLSHALARDRSMPVPFHVVNYDPAIIGLDKAPDPAPLVACIDVLEHIEPEHLNAVLDDLKRVTLRVGVFTVHCGPALKVLSDGRNAHLIQRPPTWWLPKLLERFELAQFTRDAHGFFVIVERKT